MEKALCFYFPIFAIRKSKEFPIDSLACLKVAGFRRHALASLEKNNVIITDTISINLNVAYFHNANFTNIRKPFKGIVSMLGEGIQRELSAFFAFFLRKIKKI